MNYIAPTLIDEWETGALGLSKEHAEPAADSLEREVDDALALRLISIRLPASLIDDLKLIAKNEGLGGYQPLIRRVLIRFATNEIRNMARQNASPDEATEEVMRAIA